MRELDKPLTEIRPAAMTNSNYKVEVWPYLLGQFRFKLVKIGAPSLSHDDGEVVRELCTYKIPTMTKTLCDLMKSPDPEAYCEALVEPWNSEGPGDRIRLDNREEDRPELQFQKRGQ